MISCCAAALAAASPAGAKSLPGPDGSYDYASFDSATGHLFIARGASVTDYDLATGAAPRSIGQVEHGHAALPVPGSSDLLVTSGDDATVRFINKKNGHETGRLTVGAKPDGALIDAAHGRAFVMNAKAGTVSVISLASRQVTATITLKPGLEFPALGKDGTLFVNNEDSSEIETVDTRTMKAGAAIALEGCEAPSGLAYDRASDRLISACGNGKAAIVSASGKKLVGLVSIGKGPDAVLLDAKRRRAYVPCGGSGEVDVISLATRAVPATATRITAETGARTGALDPRSGTIYLPTAQFGPSAGGKRGAMIPGTFHVLAIKPAANN